MNKQGIVVAREGNLATVQIYNNTNCLTCAKRIKQSACLNCADYDENSTQRVLALNGDAVEIGDIVNVAASKFQKILLYLISFVIPVVFAVIAYMIFSLVTDDEQIKSRAAIIAAVIAIIFAGVYSYKMSKNTCDYKIVSIIEKDED